jgi:CNT family concentrative nucleoside transporter
VFLVSYFLQYNRYLNVCGIVVVLAIAYFFSRHKKHINYALVLKALALQFTIGFFTLKTAMGIFVVERCAACVSQLYLFAQEGSGFLFGKLLNAQGPWEFIFAFQVLPVIIFFGAFMGVLFHFNIIQSVVWLLNKIVQPILGTTGAETLCAIANSFLGQTEAPLLIRHYLHAVTKSEMLVVMVSGMATISGAILVVYAGMGVPAAHLLASSVMSIPASIMIAKILYPETEKPMSSEDDAVAATTIEASGNIFDAIASGTSDGLQLSLNVGAMLIAFLGLLALVNALLGCGCVLVQMVLVQCGSDMQVPVLSIEYIFSFLFAPFGYLLGFEGSEALQVGQLIGTKIAVNELIAYSSLVKMGLSERATMITTYALCGFSNFSCIGIQIGGIGALVPQKRAWLTQLGLYAVLGGALSNILSALVAGILL